MEPKYLWIVHYQARSKTVMGNTVGEEKLGGWRQYSPVVLTRTESGIREYVSEAMKGRYRVRRVVVEEEFYLDN